MSNKKEISSEAAKINIEVTVQQPETTSDLLKENSTELVNYIANLVGNNQRNPKLICLLCWCQLTYFQKQQHLSNHTNYLRTASYYTDKTSFMELAIQYGHFKEQDKVKYFYRIKEKPATCTQQ